MSGVLQTLLKRQGKRSLSLVHQQQSWWFGKKVSLQQDGAVDGSRQYSAAAEPVPVSNDADYEKFSSDSNRSHVTVRCCMRNGVCLCTIVIHGWYCVIYLGVWVDACLVIEGSTTDLPTTTTILMTVLCIISLLLAVYVVEMSLTNPCPHTAVAKGVESVLGGGGP